MDIKCKLRRVVIFLWSGWLTAQKAITNSKIVVVLEYVWGHNFINILSNELMFLASGSYKLWHLNYFSMYPFFKTEFVWGHNIRWGLIFLEYALYIIYLPHLKIPVIWLVKRAGTILTVPGAQSIGVKCVLCSSRQNHINACVNVFAQLLHKNRKLQVPFAL